jgi:hypothetical protein
LIVILKGPFPEGEYFFSSGLSSLPMFKEAEAG